MSRNPQTDALSQHLLAALAQTPCTSDVPLCIVAFSGGADSVALLHCAYSLHKQRCLRLHAIHVHHAIRGAEADRDAAFCQNFCAEREIPFTLARVDAPAEANVAHVGLEEAARRLRYREFAHLFEKLQANWILTAHHRDDQTETVLLRLMRGTSPEGLCGIPKRRDCYLRPFLSLGKAELLDYCRQYKLPFVEDSTNAMADCPRNYLRHEVIPRLQQLQPQLSESVSRLTAQLREDEDYLQTCVAAYGETPDREALRSMPLPLLRRFMVNAYYRAGGSTTLQSCHVEAMVSLAKQGQTGKRVSLPDGLCAYLTYRTLTVARSQEDTQTIPFAAVPLQMGWNHLPNQSAIFLTDSEKDWKEMQNIYKLAISTRMISDKIIGMLYARSRQEGDTCLCRGKRHTFKHLAQEGKIDARERRSLCVVCDAAQILWIPRIACCDTVNGTAADGAYRYLLYLPKTM